MLLMCKVLGIISFALSICHVLHISIKKINLKYQKYQALLHFAGKHAQIPSLFSSFLLFLFPSICMPFTISHFYFNFSIVPVRGRLEDIGKSLHSEVKRFEMQTCCYLLESLTCNPPGPFWTQLFYQETFVPNRSLPSS